MKVYCSRIKTLPFHRRFMWIFILVFSISFIAWNTAILLQSANAWKPSMNNVNDFVSSNSVFSLKSYSQVMGRTLYSHMDMDSSWMILVRNTILGVSPSVLIPQYESALSDEVLVKNYSYAATYYSRPNSTIFSNRFDPHVDKLLTAILSPAIAIFVKRFNVIYYNNEDMTDIMIKTVPADPDFQFIDPLEAASRLNFAFEDFFFIAPSYKDIFSKDFSNLTLLAQRTKLAFTNYTICLDFEVFPAGPSAKSMQFPFYEDIDQHVIFLNPENLSQMGVFIQSSPLRSDIDYFGLLQNGYHTFHTTNGTIGYSFTLRMQMLYKIGSFHIPSNNVTDGSNLYFISHTFGGSSFELQTLMQSFIAGAIQQIQQFVIIWTIAFSLLLLSVIIFIKNYLKSLQTNLLETIQKFSKSQLVDTPENLTKLKMKPTIPIYWAAHHNLVRYTDKIISLISQRRKKNVRQQEIEQDILPLNTFNQNFQEKYYFQDFEKLVVLRRMIKDIQHSQRRERKMQSLQIVSEN